MSGEISAEGFLGRADPAMAFGVGCYQHEALSWGYDFARMERIKMARPRGLLVSSMGLALRVRFAHENSFQTNFSNL